MNKRFTSGKWKVSPEIFCENAAFEIMLDSENYEWIASVHQQFKGRENGEANARLISAAPAMFEFLEEIAQCGVIRIEEIKQLITKITTP